MFKYELPYVLRPATSRLGSFDWECNNYTIIRCHIENFKLTKKRATHPSNLLKV
jgi:hypothetical protein